MSEVVHVLDRGAAAELIRRAPRGSGFFINIRSELTIARDEEMRFPGYACLPVTRAQAVKTVLALLTETLDQRGWLVRVAVHSASPSFNGPSYFIG